MVGGPAQAPEFWCVPRDSAKIGGLAPQHLQSRTHALTGAAARGLNGAEGCGGIKCDTIEIWCLRLLRFLRLSSFVIQIPTSQWTNKSLPLSQTHEKPYTSLYNILFADDAEKCQRTNRFRAGICSSLQLSSNNGSGHSKWPAMGISCIAWCPPVISQLANWKPWPCSSMLYIDYWFSMTYEETKKTVCFSSLQAVRNYQILEKGAARRAEPRWCPMHSPTTLWPFLGGERSCASWLKMFLVAFHRFPIHVKQYEQMWYVYI